MIPGAFIQDPQEPQEVTAAKQALIKKTRFINIAFLSLSVGVLALALVSAFQFLIRREEEKGFKWAFHAFISSLLMTLTFVGIMFFVDPVFSLGW